MLESGSRFWEDEDGKTVGTILPKTVVPGTFEIQVKEEKTDGTGDVWGYTFLINPNKDGSVDGLKYTWRFTESPDGAGTEWNTDNKFEVLFGL